MIFWLNLVLTAGALGATWSTKLRWLRAYLVYLLVADVLVGILVARTSHGYAPWYLYWVGRGVGLVLLALLVGENREENRLLHMGSLLCKRAIPALLVAWLLWGWFHAQPTTHYMVLLTGGGSLLLLGALLMGVALAPRNRCVLAGSVLWVLIILTTSLRPGWLRYYPPACLIPLTVWSSDPLVSWKKKVRRARELARREVRRAPGEARDRAGLLQTAVRS